MARLTAKQKAFIYHYLNNGFNGTKAAIAAGYSEASAATIAYENLRKPHIAAEIDAGMKALAMGADETLSRLAMIARGDLGEFFADLTAGELRASTDSIAQKLAKHPKSSLMKKLKVRTYADLSQSVELELYSSLDALALLAKHHGLLVERHEIDLHAQAIRDIQAGIVTYEDIAKLDVSLAEQLFRQAGVAVAIGAGGGAT